MDPSERENSHVYTNPQSSYGQTPGRSSKLPDISRPTLIVGGLLVLALVAAGVLAWMWQQESAKAVSLKHENTRLQNSLADLKGGATPTDTAKTSKKSGFDLMQVLMQTVTTYEQAKTSLNGKQLKVQVTKWTDEYAIAQVSTGSGSPSTLYLKNVSGTWVVIGEGSANRAELQSLYGLPKDF